MRLVLALLATALLGSTCASTMYIPAGGCGGDLGRSVQYYTPPGRWYALRTVRAGDCIVGPSATLLSMRVCCTNDPTQCAYPTHGPIRECVNTYGL